MSEGRLVADAEQYHQATAMNASPPQIVSDPLVAGSTPVEQLLRALGLAANLSDNQDNATNIEQHAERDVTTRQAAEKFVAQDQEAAAELRSIDDHSYTAAEGTAGEPTQAAAIAQQLPQLASGIAAALAGAIGGVLQPLAQLPQQATQGLQQALQTGIEVAQTTGASPVEDATLDETAPTEDFDLGANDFEDLDANDFDGERGGDTGGGGLGGADGDGLGPVGGTAPTAYLGPPPVPPASTAPSSAPIIPLAPTAIAPAIGGATAGMTGMPMVPPGAMGATSGTEKDVRADTKRVSVPAVRNGAPVQGRLTVPPITPPVVKKSAGHPVVTRRIVESGHGQSADAKPDS